MGYKGRAAVHELLIINNEIRALTLTRSGRRPDPEHGA